ncbi:MipA/OmpV family protein [Shewanella colwelliana]|uniref:MipA/OmpV family protein n=1 Tax=Shewanella colwelliana TaxID=23 RepID=UPI00048AC32A|nr:MipA/OmpV family protein [Shewanella colwelliana]MDX1283227.1 MipA/OmpV family protein [Shewanella colwelliana]
MKTIISLSPLILSLSLITPLSLMAEETSTPQANYRTDDWGVAIGVRRGDIPYAVEDDEVYDVLPLLKFESDYAFINGMEGGVHLWQQGDHQINAYTRFRFVDIPKELQNESQAQAFDFGLQYKFTHGPWEADVALLSDSHKRGYLYTRTKYHWQQGDWKLTPYAEFQWKSDDFNQYYYGLEQYDVGGGVQVNAGVEARYHVVSNLYLLGQFGIGRLEDSVSNLPSIDTAYQYESFFGFGFFPEPNKKSYRSVPYSDDSDEFLRLSHGWATPSNLNEILNWNTRTDPYNNQMSSLFYGTRLSETLFTLPIELYFTPGLAWHHSSEVQNDLAEAVVAIKAFYTFELGPRFRLGVAEGLSYVSSLTHIEGSEIEEKGYKPSKLLNYLDFSLDVNMGDLFNSHNMRNMWLGYAIHHRSGIFETSSAFGRIKGGSNYQTIYLQWHF